MLCAAWELYIEEITVEIANKLISNADSPSGLPQPVQKNLSKYVREHNHDLKPLELAGAGWERVYSSLVQEVVGKLNTPKAGPIDQMSSALVGWKEPSQAWVLGRAFINEFVSIRGDIAHRGSDANYVRIGALREYRDGVLATVIQHDNAAAEFVRDSTNGRFPWRRRQV